MKFNYQARTKEGEVQAGVVEASSREAAVNLLQQRGLFVTLLEEAARPPIYARKIEFFERISKKDVVVFSRQLAIMFKSKIPLVETLRILASQQKKAGFREKIMRLAEEVEGGSSFSKALSQYPDIFSSFYIAMIRAGEASGKLSGALEYLAEHLEREYHLTSRVKGAMVYPALIFLFVIVVLLLMIFFVFPRFVKVLEETGQELPTTTLMIISLTNFLTQWGFVLLGVLIVAIILTLKYRQTEEGKRVFDKLLLKIPVLNNLLKMLYLARFAENLSTLITGGLPIAQALEITGHIIGNEAYKDVISEAKEGVKRGEPISSRLRLFPELFPPLFHQMTMVGERTGTLDKTLLEVVDFYREETNRAIESLLSLLEPLLIMALGVIVGGLMISVLMPLYKLSSF